MRECLECGLVWRANFDVDIKHYENQGIKKIDLNDEKIHAKILDMKDRVNLFSKYVDLKNLCDIGTGRGLFLKTLSDAEYENIIGIEPNSEASEFYTKNNLIVYQKTIEDGLKEIVSRNNIKVVTMFHLIEHLNDPLAAIKEVFDSLPKEGRLIIETPDINSYSIKKSNYKNKLIYKEHLYYFNKNTLRELLKKGGFKIVATGKRDFNQNNLPIRESLFRLGLLDKKKQESISSKVVFDENNQSKRRYAKNSFIKKIVGVSLSRLVVLTGRVNYIWFIAEKE